MTKTTIIVDSVCALPSRLFEKYNIKRVPITVSIDGEKFPDPCDSTSSLALFRSGKLSRKHKIITYPPSTALFERFIERAIDEDAEQVLIQTVNRLQAKTYGYATSAVSNIKKTLPCAGQVTVRVMDSHTAFSGQGLMVAETVRRLLKSQDPSIVRRQMDLLSSKIHTYLVPKSPLLAFERAQNRGGMATSWTKAFMAKTLGVQPILCISDDASHCVAKIKGFDNAVSQLFEHVAAHIVRGLLSPIIVLSYAGPLADLKEYPNFAHLEATARENKVQLITCVTSLAGGIYTSPGSLNIALLVEPHRGWIK